MLEIGASDTLWPMSTWALKAPFAASALSAITACSCNSLGPLRPCSPRVAAANRQCCRCQRPQALDSYARNSDRGCQGAGDQFLIGGIELSLCNLQDDELISSFSIVRWILTEPARAEDYANEEDVLGHGARLDLFDQMFAAIDGGRLT